MMKNVTRLILATILLAFAGFCLFGFLAAGEPGVTNVVAWRVGYAVAGICAIVAATWFASRALSLLRSK
jgi:hypothetical protein